MESLGDESCCYVEGCLVICDGTEKAFGRWGLGYDTWWDAFFMFVVLMMGLPS